MNAKDEARRMTAHQPKRRQGGHDERGGHDRECQCKIHNIVRTSELRPPTRKYKAGEAPRELGSIHREHRALFP